MDPTACLRAIRAALAGDDQDTATEHAYALLAWLDRGGFPPAGETHESARGMAVAAITGR